MLLRPLTVVAGLLASPAVRAFLLPPEVSEADIHIANTIEAIDPQITESRVVDLECPGCPVLVTGRRGSKKELQIDWPSHLELTFSVDHESDVNRLLVNGFELYPSNDALRFARLEAPQVMERNTDRTDKEKRHHHDRDHDRDHHRRPYRPEKINESIYVPKDAVGMILGEGGETIREIQNMSGCKILVPSSLEPGEAEREIVLVGRRDSIARAKQAIEDKVDEARQKSHHLTPERQPLGFSSQVKWGKKDADGRFQLVEIHLQISQVGAVYVDGIPSVVIKLIEDPGGRLLISQVDKGTPNKSNKPVEVPFIGGPQECTTVVCKWIAAARERLRKLRPFGHCRGHRMKGGMRPAVVELPQPHPHPHHHHSHAPFHKHHWGQLFKHIASHIIFPVLIGIVAGASVGLIGMAVGTMAVSTWRFFLRRHGRRHHRAGRKEAAVAEEKSGLMEHQDPPPSYEEEDTMKTVV